MADIIDSFPSVLRVIESMAEENERIKSQKRELEEQAEEEEVELATVTPQLVEGLATEFDTFNPSLIQKVLIRLKFKIKLILETGHSIHSTIVRASRRRRAPWQ